MESERQEKRHYERFIVDVMEINSKLIFANEVEILDISLGGVSVRVDRRLNIGNEYTLKIEDKSKTISLSGAVVWSRLSDARKGPDGEMIPIYTAGLKFSDSSEEKVAELSNFIAVRAGDFLQGSDVCELTGLRLNIRYNVNHHGKVILGGPACYRVKKLSFGGMLIESSHEMEVEDGFPMEVSLPDNTVISFYGRVASCIDTVGQEKGRFDVGIEFTRMSKKDTNSLREFIGTLRSSNDSPSLP